MHDRERGARGERHRIGLDRESAGDAQAAEQALDADRDQESSREAAHPSARILAPHHHIEDERGHADEHAEQAVRVLVVDAALHLAERIEQHVVAEGVRPVGNREAALEARHEAAGHEQDEDGERSDHREEPCGRGQADRRRLTREEPAERGERAAGDEEARHIEDGRDLRSLLLVAQEGADDEQVRERGDQTDLERRRVGAARDRAEEDGHREREDEERLADPEARREHRDISDRPHGGGRRKAEREVDGADHGRDADHDRRARDEEPEQERKRGRGRCGSGRCACCVCSLREDGEEFVGHRDSSRFGSGWARPS